MRYIFLIAMSFVLLEADCLKRFGKAIERGARNTRDYVREVSPKVERETRRIAKQVEHEVSNANDSVKQVFHERIQPIFVSKDSGNPAANELLPLNDDVHQVAEELSVQERQEPSIEEIQLQIQLREREILKLQEQIARQKLGQPK